MIVSYGMHSPIVKQMLNSLSVCNRFIPKDWIDLVKAVLEPGSQLQWDTWFRDEANVSPGLGPPSLSQKTNKQKKKKKRPQTIN